MRVRDARPGDARAIAEVHVASWRSTYRGQVPDDYLDGLSVDGRATFWLGAVDRTARDPQHVVVVAEDDTGRVVGFASAGPNRAPSVEAGGELHAIYLLEEAQGMGLGSALVLSVAQHLLDRDVPSMAVWVLAENARARGFYEALGAREVTQAPFTLGGRDMVEIGYIWDDLKNLVSRSTPDPARA